MPGGDRTVVDGSLSETTPLLAPDAVRSAVPGDGIAPEGVHGISGENGGGEGGEASDDDALERQGGTADPDEAATQYQGLPEVKKQLKYILPSLAIGIFLAAADQTIVVSTYGQIGSQLKALNLTSWIATAYFLTLTSFQPLYGKLSDIFGRKECLLFAYMVFGLGSVLCGLAQTMPQLIAARAFAGIGGGGMSTVVSIMFSDIVPLRERGKWQGYINIIYATGSASGAPLGGLLADTIGWRWAFLAQGPLCLVAFIAVLAVLDMPKKDDAHWKQKLRRIDFLGAAILNAAVLTLLVALDRGSNVSWRATVTLVSLGISIPLFVIFVLVEMKVAKEPFAPGHIIFSRSMVACYLCNFFSLGGALAALFYAPLYWQAVDGVTAAGAGVRLIPGIICGVTGSLVAGFYMQRTGKFYWFTVAAYALLTLGMVITTLSTGPLTHSTPLIIVGLCINALGNGAGVTTTLIGLIANASPEDQAIATACSYLFRSLGGVFGISMGSTVANQLLRQSLAAELPRLGLPKRRALEVAEHVRQSLDYLRHLRPDVRAVVVDCYARSATGAFVVFVAMVAGATISAFFIREKALNR